VNHFRQYYLDWPHEVSVETFAKCNAACTFCPYVTLDRQGERMPDEMIDRIIDELKDHPHPFVFSPFKVNEPFLDKRLIPICQKINRELPKAFLRLFSNGSALTAQHIESVAALKNVVHLWVSLNESDPVKYQETMGLDFYRTALNLDALHTAKAEGLFPHDVVVSRVSGIGGEGNDAFLDLIEGRWPLFTGRIIKRDSWLGYVEIGDAPVPDAGCGRWYELSITATGKVALCCMDGKAEFSIGDLNEQSLFEIYNSRAYRERRVKNLSRLCVHPCSSCNY
jgi:radical SAM protein with 4Fe4S-binding SPASM domain